MEQPYLCGLLLKPFDGPLVDAPTFVDEMPCGGGLARIHVADDHNVDVGLLFAHAGSGSERGQVCSVREPTASHPKLLFPGPGPGPAQPAEGEAEEENSWPRGQRRGLPNTSHLRMLWSLPQPKEDRARRSPLYLLTPRTDQPGTGAPPPFTEDTSGPPLKSLVPIGSRCCPGCMGKTHTHLTGGGLSLSRLGGGRACCPQKRSFSGL